MNDKNNDTSPLWEQLQVYLNTDLDLHVQLKRQITLMITSGRLAAGTRLPSASALASQLDINRNTVRAAYLELESNGLITTRQGLGSFVCPQETLNVNNIAGNLKSFTIGLIIPDIQNPYFPTVVRGVEDAAREKGYLVFLCNTDDDHINGTRYINSLVAHQVDGMIICPFGVGKVINKPPFTNGAKSEHPVPIVFVDRPGEGHYEILLDAKQAGVQAAEHLLKHRHKNIGFISCTLEVKTIEEVYSGFKGVLNHNKINLSDKQIEIAPVFRIEEGFKAATTLLERNPDITAIFANGDLLAIGTIQAVRAMGKRVPEDISVVGYNDVKLSEVVDPPLTTIHVPGYEMGYEAASLLIKLISNEQVEDNKLVLNTYLVERNSSGIAPS